MSLLAVGNSYGTDEKANAYNDSNGLGDGQARYDPDLAHPAAGYGDGEVATLPPGVSERKLITKIDLRVIPVLSVLYLLAFIDRTNVANAAIFGLQKDLGLSSTQYSTALTIFFVPYVLFEIASNVILGDAGVHTSFRDEEHQWHPWRRWNEEHQEGRLSGGACGTKNIKKVGWAWRPISTLDSKIVYRAGHKRNPPTTRNNDSDSNARLSNSQSWILNRNTLKSFPSVAQSP